MTDDAKRGRAAPAAPIENLGEDFASLAAAYDSVPHLVFVIGPDDTYVGYRCGGGEMPFVPPSEFMGRPVADVLPPELAGRIVGAMATARRERRTVLLDYFIDFPGDRRHYEGRFVPIEGGRIAILVTNVTEARRRDLALAESAQRLSAIVENDPDCVKVLSPAGELLEMNPAGLRMLEAASVEELRRRPLLDFIVPEHRQAFADLTRRVVAGGTGRMEFEVVGLRGTRRWLETNAVPLRDAAGEVRAVLGITRDITERRASASALQASEERFRALTERATDIIVLFDEQGHFTFASRAVAQLGWAPQELVGGMTIFDLVHPEHIELARAFVRGVQDRPSETHRILARLRHKDGSWRLIDAVIQNMLTTPAVRAVVANWRDVTEQRMLEEHYRQAQKLESIGRLAGGIAHDFNNVLTAVVGYADLLQARVRGDAEAESLVHGVRHAADRAGDLTRQLLAFARRQAVSPRPTQLNAIVEDSRRLLAPLLREDVALDTDLEPEAWPVLVDPSQVQQVIMNLAVNARDAMPRGGRLTLGTRNVAAAAPELARLGLEGPHVLLRVRDTGVGIPPDVLPHVFEPFFTTKAPGEGTGLGLATVYGIVSQLGGRLDVQSSVGAGTSVDVYFPRADVRPEPLPEQPEATGPHTGHETILLVEDDQLVRELAAGVLRKVGYDVLTAATPEEALAIASDPAAVIHLLLTDEVMPGMSGGELAHRLLAERPRLAVLRVSGFSESLSGNPDAARPGMAFLPKPYTPAVLREHVRRLLDEVAG